MDTKPARAKRRYLFIPLGIGAVLLLGYTVLWFYGAGVMREEVDEFIENERDAGRVIQYEKMKIVGFPGVLRAQFDYFEWGQPGVWNWAGERLNLIASPLELDTLRLAPRGPQAVTFAGQYYTVTPNNLRIGIAEDEYSAEVTELLAETVDGKALYLGFFKGNWNTAEADQWSLGLEAGGVIYHESEEKEARLPRLRLALAHEPGQGDEVTLVGLEAYFSDGTDGEPTLLMADGKLGMDDAGYPAGAVNLTYGNEVKLLSLLRMFELLNKDELAEGEVALRTYRRGQKTASITLTMQDGELRAAGLAKIGDLPRLY